MNKPKGKGANGKKPKTKAGKKLQFGGTFEQLMDIIAPPIKPSQKIAH